MSWILSIYCIQRYLMSRPPLSSSSYFKGDPLIFSFPPRIAQTVYILGSPCTWVGVKTLLAWLTTLSQSLLWCPVTRPPFLQSREWHMLKAMPHPLQWPGKSGAWCRSAWIRNPYTPVPLTLYNLRWMAALIATPLVCVIRPMCRAYTLDVALHIFRLYLIL